MSSELIVSASEAPATLEDARADRLTIRQGADFLGFSQWSMYRACAKGDLPHYKVGRSIRLSRRALSAIVNKKADAPATQDNAA